MSTLQLTSIALLGLALLCFPSPCVLPPLPSGEPSMSSWTSRTRWSARTRRAAVVGCGVCATSMLLDLWPWWVALPTGLCGGLFTLKFPERRSSADRATDRFRLAVRADLLAACLDAGMPVGAALLAVSEAGPDSRVGPAAEVTGSGAGGPHDDPMMLLDAVGALLMLGADTETAWRSAQRHPELAGLAAAAKRSAVAGAGFADAVREHAVALRAAGADAAERTAGRAGVAMTAPLGLCFLPAFLCLGLAPVVVGLLSTLDIF